MWLPELLEVDTATQPYTSPAEPQFGGALALPFS
jgi:hypothetical protein